MIYAHGQIFYSQLSLHTMINIWYYNFKLRDEDLSKEQQDSNWFSAPSALRVYGKFIRPALQYTTNNKTTIIIH